MRCPVCDAPLIVVERDSIEVDYCIECHGLWFDEGEIELLGEKAGMMIDLSALDSTAPSASNERYLQCPRCRKKMSKADMFGTGGALVIDFCPAQHGLWFDRGETGVFVRSSVRVQNRAADLITRFLGETFDGQQQEKVEEV